MKKKQWIKEAKVELAAIAYWPDKEILHDIAESLYECYVELEEDESCHLSPADAVKEDVSYW